MSLTLEQLKQELLNVENTFKSKTEETIKEVLANKGFATQEQYEAIEKARKEEQEALKQLVANQGEALKELLESQNAANKSEGVTLAEQLMKDADKAKRIKEEQNGLLEYMVTYNAKGELIAQPLADARKAVSIHSTVDVNTGSGLLASVVNSMSAASALRTGNGSPIVDRYENTNWLFDLVNYTTVGLNQSNYRYWEQLPDEGAAAVVAENGLKPQVQYRWELKSADYKKVAAHLKMTDEFELDFPELAQRAKNELVKDVLSQVNNVVSTDLLAQATTFAATAAWTGANGVVAPNEWDAIMAMAAQVETATFQNSANVAIMNTSKKWRINANKDTTNQYLNAPMILNQIRMVGNPAFGIDDIVVGDLKQYNLIMRGGIILKVGYVNDDLIHNRFTVVAEQFFFNYIPSSRKAAIVKGQTFATVKTAITASA